MRSKKRSTAVALVASSVGVLLVTAAIATGASSAPPVGSGKQTKTHSVCGLGTGKTAKGSPIKLGAIVTKQPGTDFTDGANMAKAYFNCVNDNGGINGHPISTRSRPSRPNPAQNAALANKLVESDKVVGMVGGFEHHRVRHRPQVLGVEGHLRDRRRASPPSATATPNSAAVNMGPRYSSDGAVQAVIRAGRQEDRVRPVERPRHRLHRGGPDRRRQGRQRPDRQRSRTTCRFRTRTRSRSSSCRRRDRTAAWS